MEEGGVRGGLEKKIVHLFFQIFNCHHVCVNKCMFTLYSIFEEKKVSLCPFYMVFETKFNFMDFSYQLP